MTSSREPQRSGAARNTSAQAATGKPRFPGARWYRSCQATSTGTSPGAGRGVSAATCNRELSFLRRVFNLALADGAVDHQHWPPTPGAIRPAVGACRFREQDTDSATLEV